MESQIIQIGKDGVRATVYVGIDTTTALMIAVAIFIGITGALFIYSRLK